MTEIEKVLDMFPDFIEIDQHEIDVVVRADGKQLFSGVGPHAARALEEVLLQILPLTQIIVNDKRYE